jgi:transposase
VWKFSVGTHFRVPPCRWVVEGTFAWLCRNRRPAKDFETLSASAWAHFYAAFIMMRTRGLGCMA